jgi:hypothetical protein
MSTTLFQAARHQYEQFITSLSPSKLENMHVSDPDGPIDPGIEISRQKMLDRFLADNPQFEPVREQLAEVRSGMETFHVRQDLWHGATR